MSQRRNRRCRNCPDEAQPSPQPVSQSAATSAAGKLNGSTLDPKILTRDGEGQKLWNHVLFGTGTCIGMMQGYANLGMPGNPVPQLQELILMLTNIKEQLEKQNAR